MLRTLRCVQTLNADRGESPHQSLLSNLAALSQLDSEFRALACVLDTPPEDEPACKDFPKVTKCFSALVTALVDHLDEIDSTSTHLAEHDIRDSVLDHMFFALWSLLYLSCHALGRFPATWPVLDPAGQPPAMQLALHCMTAFLLRVTRGSSRLWSFACATMGLDNRFKREQSVFRLLVRFIAGIHSPPDIVDVRRRLAALPSDFLPMVCCLASERFDDPSPLAQKLFAAWRDDQACAQRLDLPLMQLGRELWELISQLSHATDGHNTGISCLTNPAVTQLLTHILVTCVGQTGERAAATLARTIDCTIALLESGPSYDLAFKHPPDEDLAAQIRDGLVHVHPALLIPSIPVTDVQLLRALLHNMPAAAHECKRWYKLAGIVMRCEFIEDPLDTPQRCGSASSGAHQAEKVRSVRVAAHHSCTLSVAWMRQQQQQQQADSRQSMSGSSSSLVLPEGWFDFVASGYAAAGVSERLSDVETKCGEWQVALIGLHPVLKTQQVI